MSLNALYELLQKTKRKARMGRNPQTGKEIKIPAMTVPKFRPGREFKEDTLK